MNIKRMEEEFSMLNDKIIKIQCFLGEEKTKHRCKTQILLLRKQLAYMLLYRETLRERINAAENKVESELKDVINKIGESLAEIKK
ncbi:MAG: crAss001_48 related protein [Fusobacteriaceae bacterium]